VARLTIEVAGVIVGLVQFCEEEDPDYRSASLDIYIDPAVHRRGYAGDAIRIIADHLFDHRGHHRLTIDPAVDNQPAIRCYSSVGFQPVGVMRSYERRADGTWADGLLMEMLASDRLAGARAGSSRDRSDSDGVGDGSGASESDHLASTRAVYDHATDQYVDAVGTTVSPRFEAPLDRAVLDVFAESVREVGSGTVLDAGCGPGRVAAYLAERGLDARGVDISAAMIEAARAAHPHLRFDEGRLTTLPVADRSMRGVVYWYSIIATPPDDLAPVWAELHRVLDDDGRVLVAFQAGQGEPFTRPDAFGSGAELTLYRHAVADVSASLRACGFEVRAQVQREPCFAHETTPQAFLLAERSDPQRE
jgi:SAM-dependent methyltransferase